MDMIRVGPGTFITFAVILAIVGLATVIAFKLFSPSENEPTQAMTDIESSMEEVGIAIDNFSEEAFTAESFTEEDIVRFSEILAMLCHSLNCHDDDEDDNPELSVLEADGVGQEGAGNPGQPD